MRPIVLVLLLIAVAGVAGTEAINVSLPDRDAPEAVLGTVESMWGFVEWLLQVADDLLMDSDLILPYPDATLDQLKQWFEESGSDEGLIPG